MKRHSRSSGFPARDPQPQCHASGVFFEPQRTQRPQRQDNGREPAAFVCAVRLVVGFQGDLPPHPRPLSPVPGARGGFCVFQLQWKSRIAPLAPGRGEGSGVRGEGPLGCRCFEPRMDTNAGVGWEPRMDTNERPGWPRMAVGQRCFLATDEHGFSRMNRRGSWAFSPFNFLVSTLYGMDAIAPSPPTPLPRSGGEGSILCF